MGKSTLARVWAEMLAEDHWRGAERAFAWSFYSQGTGRMTDADSFIDEALHWFGDETPEKGSPWDKGERLAALIRKAPHLAAARWRGTAAVRRRRRRQGKYT